MMPDVHVSQIPTAGDLARDARRRNSVLLAATVLLALLCGFSYTAMGLDTPILPLVVLLLVLTPVVLWRYPRLGLYVPFVSVCLFELFQSSYKDALTDRVPFFWNINTILQVYAHANFKAVPLNLMEVFLLVIGLMSLVRAVFYRQISLRGGPLLLPIAIYIGFVVWACINGMATGGDFKIALQESRAQFYFLISYLMGVNLITERRQVENLLWIVIGCIGLKGILYTFRRYVTLAGQPLPDQGVGSHEEAFFFDSFVVLLLINSLCGIFPRMRRVQWLLLPLVILGNLATNRRAGTAALAIAIIIVLLAAYRCLPERRKALAVFAGAMAVLGPLYYAVFKNSESAIAQPARAIKSQFSPSTRDALSNLYREQESTNILATIKSAPVQGFGYGKRMFHAVEIADISHVYDWWDVLPHNQILWVWMRVGTIGFIAFWMMIAAIVIWLCHQIRRNELDRGLRGLLMFVLSLVAMLLIFGLLDLQLSNFRDMLYVGFWIGAACAVVPAEGTEAAAIAAPAPVNHTARGNKGVSV